MYKIGFGIALGLLLFGGPAMAACSSYPYSLTNGTTADATQVMANFNCATLSQSPTIAGSLTVTATSANPMVTFSATGFSANALITSTSGGQASLNLNGATGNLSEIYNSINGTAYWSSGITGYGGTNAYAWYSYTLGGPAFYINTNGNANVAGCLVYNGGTLGTCLSDLRTKKNVVPFRAGLQQIASLSPVTYEYNGLGETDADGKVRTGLVAQDVEAVAPELVQTTDRKLDRSDSGSKPLLAVKYGDLTFALINAVKELKSANDNQSAEITKLETKVAALERKLGTKSAQR